MRRRRLAEPSAVAAISCTARAGARLFRRSRARTGPRRLRRDPLRGTSCAGPKGVRGQHDLYDKYLQKRVAIDGQTGTLPTALPNRPPGCPGTKDRVAERAGQVAANRTLAVRMAGAVRLDARQGLSSRRRTLRRSASAVAARRRTPDPSNERNLSNCELLASHRIFWRTAAAAAMSGTTTGAVNAAPLAHNVL